MKSVFGQCDDFVKENCWSIFDGYRKLAFLEEITICCVLRLFSFHIICVCNARFVTWGHVDFLVYTPIHSSHPTSFLLLSEQTMETETWKSCNFFSFFNIIAITVFHKRMKKSWKDGWPPCYFPFLFRLIHLCTLKWYSDKHFASAGNLQIRVCGEELVQQPVPNLHFAQNMLCSPELR